MATLVIDEHLAIPDEELEFTFARSSGPGGQNVNKVNSKAQLRWPVAHNRSLPEEVRRRFLARFHARLTAEGELLLASQRYRDQARNVAECLERLRAMVLSVAAAPTRRKKTKPGRGAIERRLQGKRLKSEKKQRRGWSGPQD